MPNIETAWRYQKALYWPADGFDKYGRPNVDMTQEAIELDVRWEDVNTEILDPHGNTVRIDATVVVDRVIPEGSVLWKGGLEDLTGTAEGTPTSDLMYVKSTSEIPDIKARYYRRIAYLMRLADSI